MKHLVEKNNVSAAEQLVLLTKEVKMASLSKIHQNQVLVRIVYTI